MHSTEKEGLRLAVQPGDYGCCRLPATARIPRWVHRSDFFNLTRTDDELSILCRQEHVPADVKCERDWALIKVLGTLDFSLIGVLASMAEPLAQARIGLLTVSTYDTDYLMVRQNKLDDAIVALEAAGHRFEDTGHDAGAPADADESEAPAAADDAGDTRSANDDEQLDEPAPAKRRRRSRRRRPRSEGSDAAADPSPISADAAESTETADSTDAGQPEAEEAAPRRRRGSRTHRRPTKPAEEAAPAPKPAPRSRKAASGDEPRRGRPSGRGRGRSRNRPRPGGSLYIGEEWEHIEDDTPSAPLTFQAAFDDEDGDEATDNLDDSTARPAAPRKSASRTSTRRRRTPRAGDGATPEAAPAPKAAAALEIASPPDVEETDGPAEDAPPAATRRRTRTRRSRTRHERPREEPAADGAAEIGPRRDRDQDTGKYRSKAISAEPEIRPVDSSFDPRPADERDTVDDDGGDDADGLYTGAIPQNPVETTEDDFGSLGLSARMVQTLSEIGFIHPTPIQAAVLPMALEGSDIVGLAETGSGKTGAFGLPLAERLHHGRGVRGLILCPTREIALQTKGFLDIFGRDHELETAVVIGGVKFQPQINALKRHPDIIVATPGRLADHMRRGNVRMNQIEELVLDEADHMLDLGFLPQIQEIVARVPRDRRTMMFSATMPPSIERLAQRFLNDPYLVDLRPVNRVASGIEHRLYLVDSGEERKCLVALLQEVEDTTLVFARRKLDTEFLARQLQLAELPAERIHSDRSQAQRVKALRGFREGKKRILVATDVAARGIDVPHLGHVINFGMPDSVEDYVHRAGRTARGKAVGIVSSVGTWKDKPMVKEIERVLGKPIARCEVEGVDAYRELAPKRGRRRRRLL